MDYESILRPASIALVGVTDRPGFGRAAALSTIRSRAAERVYYVSPTRASLFGRPCYPSLSVLPEKVDCVVVLTNGVAAIPILREAGELGVKGAIVYASGFSEDGTEAGALRESELAQIGKQYDMAILGPNCMGMFSPMDKVSMWAGDTFWSSEPIDNGIGLICQSGFVVCQLADMEAIACAFSTGNGNVVTLEDLFEQIVVDSRVRVISLYLEGLKDPNKFVSCLRTAASMQKPVIVLKSGRSEIGVAAAASHTGTIAGSHRSFTAICEKYGAILVDDIQELKAMSEIHVILQGKHPRCNAYAALNFSGGENIICADMADKYSVNLPLLQPGTIESIQGHLPRFAVAANPLDLTTAMLYARDPLSKVIAAYENDLGVGALLIGSSIEIERNQRNDILLESIRQARVEGLTIPIFIIPTLEGTRSVEYRRLFAETGVVLLPHVSTAFKLLNRYNSFARIDPVREDRHAVIPDTTSDCAGLPLSEFDSKEMLKDFAEMMPKYGLARGISELEELAREIPFPWALKVNSDRIAHKSEIGGVVLNVEDLNQACYAYHRIMDNVKNSVYGDVLSCVLISEMASAGTELIVGVQNDSQFGPMMLIGAGGIYAEILKDTVVYPAPMNHREALAQIKRLRLYQVLRGARGQGARDIGALTQLIVELSQFAYSNKSTIREIDLNPVRIHVDGSGLSILDTLVVLKNDV